jgi:hypothetical protein
MLTMNDILNPPTEHIKVGDYVRSKTVPNMTGRVVKVMFNNVYEDAALIEVLSPYARCQSKKQILYCDLKYWEKVYL